MAAPTCRHVQRPIPQLRSEDPPHGNPLTGISHADKLVRFPPAADNQIFQVWVENFAWDARDQFGGDLIVKQDDEGEFVDSLAEFLWEHRDQLANVLDNEETPS